MCIVQVNEYIPSDEERERKSEVKQIDVNVENIK